MPQDIAERVIAAKTTRKPRRDRNSSLRLPAPLVWTLWIFGIAFFVPGEATAEEVSGAPVPSWKRGISRWNGTGYDLPPASLTASSPVSSPKTTPYTMPVDPSAPTTSGPSPESKPWENVNFADLPSPASIELSGPDLGVSPSDRSSAQAQGSDSNDESVQELPPPRNDTNDTSQAIGEKLNSAEAAATAGPLEQDVVRWYQYPQRWMRGWDSHAELGLDGSNGNADTLAIQTGLELKRKEEAYTLAIDVNYRQASTGDVVTEDNGRLNIDYDRILGDSPWGGFGKLGLEWDRFKAFNLRVNLNGGVGYHWIRSDTTTLVTRFGAGANQEIGAPDDDWVAEGVFGIEAERQLTARQKLIGKVDYFPAWEDFSNYRLVSDFAWEILLDGSENLSLKLAATDRYDSTPQGAKPNDVYYSLLLLYKF